MKVYILSDVSTGNEENRNIEVFNTFYKALEVFNATIDTISKDSRFDGTNAFSIKEINHDMKYAMYKLDYCVSGDRLVRELEIKGYEVK